jgi:hypothetical protein
LLVQDGPSDFGGESLEFVERAARGDSSFFEERGVENEGAAIHEGMIGRFERLAEAASGSVASEKVLIQLQIRLKFESLSGRPSLLAGECGEKFAAEGDGILAKHRLGLAASGGKRFGVGDFESAGGKSECGLTLEESEEIAIKSGVDLKGVTAVFENVGVYETRNYALALECFGEAES